MKCAECGDSMEGVKVATAARTDLHTLWTCNNTMCGVQNSFGDPVKVEEPEKPEMEMCEDCKNQFIYPKDKRRPFVCDLCRDVWVIRRRLWESFRRDVDI